MYICIYVHIYIHTYIHTYTYVLIHVVLFTLKCVLQVDMVKVVLCRFIKSQLDGISLRNAVRKTCKMNLRQAGNKADKIADALFK